MLETIFVTICGYFQYFWRVLNNLKKQHETRPYINAKSIKKQFEQKQRNVTIKLLITVTSFSKYQSITLTKIMLKIEANN